MPNEIRTRQPIRDRSNTEGLRRALPVLKALKAIAPLIMAHAFALCASAPRGNSRAGESIIVCPDITYGDPEGSRSRDHAS